MVQQKSIQLLLEDIRRKQSSFSAAQKLVAAYVVENSYQIPFLSITQLAKNIGVSDNTVIKFCNQLGYSKFGEFKKEFSACAHTELVMSNKLSESGAVDENDFLAIGMEEDIAAVQSSLADPANKQALSRLLPMLDKAKTIYITGGRASGYMAGIFVNALRYLGLKVHQVSTDMADYWDRLSMVDREDLVIAISFPRYTAQVVQALERLHQAGVPIALITDTGLSPAQECADLVFRCSVSSGYYFPCYAGCLSLISAICRAAGAARRENAAEHIEKMERQLLEQGVFL